MIIDTSAVFAIVTGEAEAASFVVAIDRAVTRRLSAPSYVEASIALSRLGDPAIRRDLDLVVAGFGISIEPFTAGQARLAADAWRDFGRASGHPARLNFGDCLTYALAMQFDEPLLYKGDDFGHTGIRNAVA